MTNLPSSARLTIWLLSPYHSGSHREWAEGYQKHSRHCVQLFTMTGRFWKWRMQGAAIELAAQTRAAAAQHAPDLVLATDMINIADWIALMARMSGGQASGGQASGRPAPGAQAPVVLYMHENQLTYPLRPGVKQDLTYAMINWLSQLCADRVLFNTEFHRRSWFAELPNLLKHFPDYNRLELIEEVEARSGVLPVGIEPQAGARVKEAAGPPLILWNQRWEYDKRPDRFFQLLYRLEGAGYDYRLAVAGENFRRVPEEFEEAQERLAHRIEHWGYLPSRGAYLALLENADLVISTADHEFFGISVLEAVQAGAFPLLPNRLSYPELIPASLHAACLYSDEDDLFSKAVRRLTLPRRAPPSLRRAVRERFSWPVVAGTYDAAFTEIVNSGDAVGKGGLAFEA